MKHKSIEQNCFIYLHSTYFSFQKFSKLNINLYSFEDDEQTFLKIGNYAYKPNFPQIKLGNSSEGNPFAIAYVYNSYI